MAATEFVFYGGNAEFVAYKGPEAIVHGPAETGKTISALWKLHLCAMEYDNASIVIIRKTQRSIYETVLETYHKKVLGGHPEAWGISAFGGQKPEWYDYVRTGSRIWMAGMDKPEKVLSAERDIIYVNQVEELSLEDWETLTTRTTGRAGHMPYNQTIGDANPAWPAHWMYHRDSLRMFASQHIDNPTLYHDGELTPQGRQTLDRLQALTGVRRARLYEGVPAQAEGAVYPEYNETIHRVYEDKVLWERFVRFVGAVDWGYREPGVILLWGVTSENEMYTIRQIYRTGKRDDWWINAALSLEQELGVVEAWACDPSRPAYIDAWRDAGLNAIGADSRVQIGIDTVKKFFDNRKLFFVRGSLTRPDERLRQAKLPYQVEDEIPSYVWKDMKGKEQPIKEDDHGCDATRYGVMYVNSGRVRASAIEIPGYIEHKRRGSSMMRR